MVELPTLLIATHNVGKLEEFKKGLSANFICRAPDKPLDVKESGKTYKENASLKADAYLKAFGGPVLADDSGLEVEALGGEPGVYSARFGGSNIAWPERWEKLRNEMESRSENSRAIFRCVLCYFDGREKSYFEATAEGKIVFPPRGDSGFGYDPIFYCFQLGKTFAQANTDEKMRASHRGLALGLFRRWWSRKSGASMRPLKD